MSLSRYDDVSAVIRNASAQFIMPRYKALSDHEISSKTNPTDLVTQADTEAEYYLEQELPKIIQGSIVIGEEGVSRGEKDLNALNDKDQTTWVVDPVDGTYNFVHGNQKFGVMVALVKGGETIASWIFDPLNDSMTYAEKGKGAHKDGNALKITSPGNALNEIDIYLSPKFFPSKIRDNIKSARSGFKSAGTIGCAAHEYLDVAQNKRSATIYCRLKPWDHLAGVLLIQESGGYVAKWDETPYTPQDIYGGLIATDSKENWQAIYDHVFSDIDLSPYLKK